MLHSTRIEHFLIVRSVTKYSISNNRGKLLLFDSNLMIRLIKNGSVYVGPKLTSIQNKVFGLSIFHFLYHIKKSSSFTN